MNPRLLFPILFFCVVSFVNAQTTITLSSSVGGGQDTYSSTNVIACLSGGGPAPYQDPILKLGRFTGGCTYNSYIQFNGVLNTALIPENAVITKAELKMYRTTGQALGGNNDQDLVLLTEQWIDQNVTNTTLPSEMVAMNSYPGPITITGGTNAQWITVDVLPHVEFMHCRKINYGWVLKTQSTNGIKNVRYASLDHATLKPYIEIEYYLPMTLSLTSHPSSGPAVADASITVDAGSGSQSFTASWYDLNWNSIPPANIVNTNFPTGLTTKLYSVLHGGYLLEVTDNNSGEIRRIITLVGTNGGVTTVALQPNPFWGFDAKVNSGPVSTTGFNYIANGNFGTTPIFGSSRALVPGTGKGLIDFKYEGLTAEEYEIEQADLFLFGLASTPHSGNNESVLQRITGDWDEECITWVLQPNTTTTDQLPIGPLSNSVPYIGDVLPFAKYWLEHPDEKFGMMLSLVSISGNAQLNFGSSDQVIANNWPKLVLKFRHKNQYAELRRKLDGGYYQVKSNLLNFQFIDNYSDEDNKLSFKIINPLLPVTAQVVYSDTDVTLDPDYGENRFSVDCGCTGAALDKGFYILEVTNSKNEKSYLRIYQPEDPNCN